jgi:DNA-binding transcriptional regulator LsrR (DeoR family)
MNDFESEKLLSKIARLYYLEDMNQNEIAEKFDINRVKVSRYLKKAREKKVVEIKINYPRESYHDIERQIERKYGLKECIIVPAHESPQDILKDMASALSSVLDRVLGHNDYFGVNWGLTLKGITDYLQPKRKVKINVVPIVGGLGKIETGIHTNSIAKNFADIFGGIGYVINTPAIVDTKEIKLALLNDSNTKEIFELTKRLSAAIFSYSDIGHESSYRKYGLIKNGELKYLKDMDIVGDVNLDFLNDKGEHVPNKISDRVIALPITEIKKIRNVIGIAYGVRKVAVTLAVLRGRIVNILVIDKNIADSIIG